MKDKQPFNKNTLLIVGVIIIVAIVLFFALRGTNTNEFNSVQPTSQNSENINHPDTKKTVSLRRGEGYSRDNPAPINKSLITEYQQAGEPRIKAEITLLQALRGQEALDKIQGINPYDSPDEGQEYVLLKIKYRLLEVSEGDKGTVSQYYFNIVSEGGAFYDSDITDAGALLDPEPRLHRDMFSGATHEGWVSYDVNIGDNKPLLLFEPAGLSDDSDRLWFKLY